MLFVYFLLLKLNNWFTLSLSVFLICKNGKLLFGNISWNLDVF